MKKLFNKCLPDKNIEYYSSERKEILEIFPDKVSRVLDVGCGSGIFGRALRQKGIEVFGIEENIQAAEIAKKNIDKVIIGDIEDIQLDFNENFFDVIVFADVIEHLKDPWTILEKSRGFLRPKGYFLISIPNIRYYRILLDIIFKGEFNYEESGILDIGHLRFFTFKTLLKYLNQLNFKIIKHKRNFSGHFSWLLNKLFFDLFADFFTRQHIIIAQYSK
jgi:2-polyprenyl-3-methyl-5-hydroxy-6-metoxy-1,4-benzoquinol methylase